MKFNKIKTKGMILLAVLVFLPLVSAEIVVDIDVWDSFSEGERLFFDYTLESDSDVEVIIIPHIKCPSAPIAFLREEIIDLNQGEVYQGSYEDMEVDELFEPQTCEAYIQFISPIRETVRENFVIDTDPSLLFEVNLCEDESCFKRSKIFVLGNNIYLDYSGDVKSLSITAILTYPDKTTKQMSLPTSVMADQVGSYVLDVEASKRSYKTATKKIQFAVIEENAEIIQVSFSPVQNDVQSYLIPIIVMLIGALVIFLVAKKIVR